MQDKTKLAPKPNVPVHAIVAMDKARIIGNDGKLPWHLPEDLKNFSKLTRDHSVLMGRKTFDSLPDKFKPLPQRLNLVLSRSKDDLGFAETKVFSELEEVSKFCGMPNSLKGEVLWVIGGEQVYRLTASWWDKVFVTRVAGAHAGDAYFPAFEGDFELIESKPSEGCSFEIYQRRS